jgi:putative ABC transport system substrate-binding protein
MRRREFMTLLGGAAVSSSIWPLAARAQQPAMPVIGFVSSRSASDSADVVSAFRRGLSESGFVEGHNVAIEYRWADGQYDRLPALAADLVRRRVMVISAIGGIPVALAAKGATSTIPIVFQVAPDPVKTGLVVSLARPGGNLTGITTLNAELGPKKLEMLHEIVPKATTIAVLVNPTNPVSDTLTRDAQAAASVLKLQIHVLQASTEHEFDSVFANLVQLRVGGLVIGNDPFLNAHVQQLGALTLRHAVPAIFQYREFAAAGGLMSYGTDFADSYRFVGVYTGRILKGENPADLPVQQVTKVELIVNLKTAKALGLTVPLTLLGRADEVIE